MEVKELDIVIDRLIEDNERYEELAIYYLQLTSIGDLNKIQAERDVIRNAFEKIDPEYGEPCIAMMDAVYYYFISDGAKAIAKFEEVLPPNFQWKSRNITGTLQVLLGGTYRSIGELDKCIYHQLIAKSIFNAHGDLSRFLVFCYYNLSEVYMQINELEQAAECLREGLNVIVEKENKFRLLSSLGNLHLTKNELHAAEEYFLEAKYIAEGNSQNARVLYDLALLEIEKENFKKAIEYAQESYDIRIDSGLRDAASSSQILIGKSHRALNNLEEALKHLYEALETTKEFEAKAKSKEVYQLLSTIHESKGNWEEAYKCFKQYEEFQSGLFSNQQKEIFKLKNAEIRKQKGIIEEAHKEITDSINYAERIQHSFLPSDEKLDALLNDYFVLFQPKDVVSGDFYWADQLPNGDIGILNADSTGHGVPGSIMSIVNCTAIERAVKAGATVPNDIFNEARKSIIHRLKNDGSEEGGKDGMDASLIAINPDYHTKMHYVAANNPIWIMRSAVETGEAELIEIKPEKMPVGKHENDQTPFLGGVVPLVPGDCIYTLTDGYQDQFGGPRGKKFKVKPLKQIIYDNHHLPMREQKSILHEKFIEWKGELEQVDDVCIIGIKL
ncbi:MAG: SpoIIE family protein phosphatase [Crocinitomicaceae bacterium]|nr:SpoIIE family protein phosphatase [Crocinitomicaceae bacterium]